MTRQNYKKQQHSVSVQLQAAEEARPPKKPHFDIFCIMMDRHMKNVFIYINIVSAHAIGVAMVPLLRTVHTLDRTSSSVFRKSVSARYRQITLPKMNMVAINKILNLDNLYSPHWNL